MKNSTKFSVGALLLAAALLASCAGDPSDKNPSSDEGSETLDTRLDGNDAALQLAVNALPDVDYGGYTMNFLIQDNQGSEAQHIDIFAEKDDGEPITAAVWKRNSLLAEHLNIKITETLASDETPAVMARQAVRADEHVYDVVVDALAFLAPIIPEGIFYDWNEVPGINLDAEWWDQDMREQLSIANKNYFMTGDISIRDNQAIVCMFFNIEMAGEYDYDLYGMVKDNTWTIDALYKMAKEVSKEMDGDGKKTLEGDQWGLLDDNSTSYTLWIGTGETVISKDKDDLPVLNPLSTRGSSVMEVIVELQKDKNTTYNTINTIPDDYNKITDAFRRGGSLFYSNALAYINDLRDSEYKVGLLPMPKYDETQSEYLHTQGVYWGTAFAIPANFAGEDLERTGTVLEAMAELSAYTLTPAYFDITLEGKAIRDEDSVEMLDIILSNRSYDLAAVFDWGNMVGQISDIAKNNKNLSTIYAERERATEKAIESYVEQLENLE